jgi:hypothetical protein
MRHRVKVAEKTKEHVAKNQCSHYWIIEMANGPKSRGICKHCGEARYFLNVIPDSTALKRNTHPLDLPEIPDVELDEDSKS